MHDTAAAVAAETATPSTIAVFSRTIDRISDLTTRVGDTTDQLTRAAKEHKDAKTANEAAHANLSAAVNQMLREIRGESDLPLFDNMSDAIARAEADPIAQKLLTRLIDHGVTHVNQLVVAGYNETQRNDLAAYLDALDVRKKAEAEGQTELPELLEMPEFLAAQPEVNVTQESIDEMVARLREQGLELNPAHIAALTYTHWLEVFGWLNAIDVIKAEKGDALVMDDLPAAPSYLLNPAEVLPATESEPAAEPESAAPKKSRAPRRSSAEFKNSPRVVKTKKGKRS